MKSKYKVSHVRIQPAANKGHTVTTSYDEGMAGGGTGYQPPTDHVFGADQHKQMMQHVASQLGVDESGEDPQEEASETPAQEQAEQKPKGKPSFPMKGRAAMAMHMVRRAEATSKAKGKRA